MIGNGNGKINGISNSTASLASKKVSFASEEDLDDPETIAENNETLSRLEQVEKDPNVSNWGYFCRPEASIEKQ